MTVLTQYERRSRPESPTLVQSVGKTGGSPHKGAGSTHAKEH